MNADRWAEWAELFVRAAAAGDAVDGEEIDEADVTATLDGCRDAR